MKLLVFLFGCLLASGLELHVDDAVFASEYDLLRKLSPAIIAQLSPGHPDSQGFIGFHQRQGQWFEAGIGVEQPLAPVSAARDVVPRPGPVDPQRPCDAANLRMPRVIVNNVDLTPLLSLAIAKP